MDLDKKQIELFEPIKDGMKESIAAKESMGASHSFAKLAEKVELVDMMLIPAMTSTGKVSGEVKKLYSGKGPDNDELKKYLAEVMTSVSLLSSLFSIKLSEVAEMAFKEKD